MRTVVIVVGLFFALSCSQSNAAPRRGALGYAAYLNRTGTFRHARNHGGAEVIYRSSGRANRFKARRAWMKSPAHRRLLVSGRIRSIRCVGSVCVGRGR